MAKNKPDIYSAYIELYLNGKEFTAEQYASILDITHVSSSNDSDRLEITISDSDMTLIEQDLYTKSASIDFTGGWSHDPSITFSGKVSFIDIDFPDSGDVNITMVCADNSSKINRIKKKKVWSNSTLKDAVVNVLNDNGLTPEFIGDLTNLNIKESSIVQQNETDMVFLKRKLNEKGFFIKIVTSKAIIQKKDLVADAITTMSYKKDDHLIKSFRPSINKEDVKDSKTTENVDASTKSATKEVTKNGSESDKQGKAITNDGSNNSSGYKYNPGGGWTKTTK